MSISQITYFPIFDLPLVAYLGIITLLLLFTTATLGLLTRRGKVQFKYHRMLAYTTIVFALIHGLLALLAYIL